MMSHKVQKKKCRHRIDFVFIGRHNVINFMNNKKKMIFDYYYYLTLVVCVPALCAHEKLIMFNQRPSNNERVFFAGCNSMWRS